MAEPNSENTAEPMWELACLRQRWHSNINAA